jgi:hypothetical protein
MKRKLRTSASTPRTKLSMRRRMKYWQKCNSLDYGHGNSTTFSYIWTLEYQSIWAVMLKCRDFGFIVLLILSSDCMLLGAGVTNMKPFD